MGKPTWTFVLDSSCKVPLVLLSWFIMSLQLKIEIDAIPKSLGRHFYLLLNLQFFSLFLVQLLESFQQSFPTLEFPPLPERGDFDLKEVLESPYFFNWSKEISFVLLLLWYHASFIVSLSSHLAYYITGRGKLNEALPKDLWWVLHCIYHGRCNGAPIRVV